MNKDLLDMIMRYTQTQNKVICKMIKIVDEAFKVGATVVRIILKEIAAGFVGLLELSIAVNMTMKN